MVWPLSFDRVCHENKNLFMIRDKTNQNKNNNKNVMLWPLSFDRVCHENKNLFMFRDKRNQNKNINNKNVML